MSYSLRPRRPISYSESKVAPPPVAPAGPSRYYLRSRRSVRAPPAVDVNDLRVFKRKYMIPDPLSILSNTEREEAKRLGLFSNQKRRLSPVENKKADAQTEDIIHRLLKLLEEKKRDSDVVDIEDIDVPDAPPPPGAPDLHDEWGFAPGAEDEVKNERIELHSTIFAKDELHSDNPDAHRNYNDLFRSVRFRLQQMQARYGNDYSYGIRVIVIDENAPKRFGIEQVDSHDIKGVGGVKETTDIGKLMRDFQTAITRGNPRSLDSSGETPGAIALSTWYMLRAKRNLLPGGNHDSTLNTLGTLYVAPCMDRSKTDVKSGIQNRYESSHYRVADHGSGDGYDCFILALKGCMKVATRFSAKKFRDVSHIQPGPIPVSATPDVAAALCAALNKSIHLRVISDRPLEEKTHIKLTADYSEPPEKWYKFTVEYTDQVLIDVHLNPLGLKDEPTLCEIVYHPEAEHFTRLTQRFNAKYCPQSGLLLGRHESLKSASIGKIREELIKQMLFTPKEDKKEEVTEEEIEVEENRNVIKSDRLFDCFVTLDYETTFDQSKRLQPYAYSLRVDDVTRKTVFSRVFDQAMFFDQVDMLRHSIETLHKETSQFKRVCVISYNGSGFENYLLWHYLAHQHTNNAYIRYFQGGSKILKLQWRNKYTNYTTWDPLRFTNCSLKSACKDFQTKTQKVDGFSHVEPQRAAEQGKLDEWLNANRPKLHEYNKADTDCLMELFYALRDAHDEFHHNIDDQGYRRGYPIEHSMTIAGCALQIWESKLKAGSDAAKHERRKAHLKKIADSVEDKTTLAQMRDAMKNSTGEQRRELRREYKKTLSCIKSKKLEQTPLPDIHELPIGAESRAVWNKFRQAMIGGRTQCFRRIRQRGRFECIDACSLYPFVMLKRAFPVGPERAVEREEEGKIGIYRCTIHFQKAEELNVVPRRSEEESLDWNYKGVMEVHLTSVDIADMRLYHGEDSITVHEGWVWDHKRDDLFKEFILPFKLRKMQEDLKKSQKDPNYNPCMRQLCKLFMNSLSGKVGQRLFDSETVYVNSYDDLQSKIFDSQDKYASQVIHPVGDTGGYMIKSNLTEEYAHQKYHPSRATPCHLSAFIYSYARSHMLRTVLRECPGRIGMDTDSLFAPVEEIDLLQQRHPELFGDEFGQFKREMSDLYSKAGLKYHRDTSEQVWSMLMPKTYNVVDVTSGKAIKMTFKGVSQSDRIITKDSPQSVLDWMGLQVREGVLQFKEREIVHFGKRKQYAPKHKTIAWQSNDVLEGLPFALSDDLYRRLFDGETVVVCNSGIKKSWVHNGTVGLLEAYVPYKMISLPK